MPAREQTFGIKAGHRGRGAEETQKRKVARITSLKVPRCSSCSSWISTTWMANVCLPGTSIIVPNSLEKTKGREHIVMTSMPKNVDAMTRELRQT